MNEVMGLNIFDLVVIALILLLSLKGLVNGFAKEFFSAVGLIGGIFVASYLHKDVANYLHENFIDFISVKALSLISLIVIFFIFWFIVSSIGKAISSLNSSGYISTTSRLGGMLVNIIKLFFVFSLIVYAFAKQPQVKRDFKNIIESSKLFPLLKDTGAAILNMPIISDLSISDKNNTHKATTIKEDNTSQKSKEEDKNISTKEINTTIKAEVKEDMNLSKESIKESNSSDSNSSQN